MSTAIAICADAFRQANLDQELIGFSGNQEFPYNIALSLINNVIQEMNRMGNYWFTETVTDLPDTPGATAFDLNALGVDPKRIIRLRREALPYAGELVQRNWRDFQQAHRSAAIATGTPQYFAKFSGQLHLDVIPDRNYQIKIYHFQDIPLVSEPGDTLPVPAGDEDVLRDGVYAYLCQRLGRADYAQAQAIYLAKIRTLLAAMKTDAGIPNQMPANF